MALVTFVNDSEPYLNAENLNNNFESCVTPSGAIMQYAGTTAPNGWLICDGSAISRTIYSDLFDVIGTTYGSGDGSTTFNLPNLKGRIPVGLDNTQTEFDAIGETGGEKTHKLLINEMPKHRHEMWVYNSNGDGTITDIGQNIRDGINTQNILLTPPWKTFYRAFEMSERGGDAPHNNLQPYIVLNYIIKS